MSPDLSPPRTAVAHGHPVPGSSGAWSEKPVTPAERRIEASAPVRICDNGGWTDTWFGGPGRIVNIAAAPGVEVSIRARPGRGQVLLHVKDFGDRYPVVPGRPRVARHALLEAAVDALPPPEGADVEIALGSAVPAGCGTGTSASVAVALLGALAALRGEHPSPSAIAYLAHRLEVDVLGHESGIQDQLSAALGGINYIEVDHYPEAMVRPLPAWEELGPRLTVVFLGRPHDSSSLHREVIGRVTRESGELRRLREAAVMSRDAVLSRDLAAFGRAMVANTEAQGSLCPALVGAAASRVMELAGAEGAMGWKVNGAGGNGGSVTVLSADPRGKASFERRLAAADGRWRLLPLRPSRTGLQVRDADEIRPDGS